MTGTLKISLPHVPPAPCDGCPIRRLCALGFTCAAYRAYIDTEVQPVGFLQSILHLREEDIMPFTPLTDEVY